MFLCKYVLYVFIEREKVITGSDGSVSIRGCRAYVLVKFASVREHDERNLSITENSEFLCFLENTISPLRVSDLSVGRVFNSLDLDLSPTHISE